MIWIVLSTATSFLGVVVQNADAVETHQDKYNKIDANKDPQEAVDSITASIPVDSGVIEFFAESLSSILNIIGEEAVPDQVDNHQDKSQQVALIEHLSEFNFMSLDETHDEAGGKDAIDNSTPNVGNRDGAGQIEAVQHEDDDYTADQWASAAALVCVLSYLADAHIFVP